MSRRGGKAQARGGNQGPAIMMMPPHIRATFMPNPPLRQVIPDKKSRRHAWSGMTPYLSVFEKDDKADNEQKGGTNATQGRASSSGTLNDIKERARKEKAEENKKKLQPIIEEYRAAQKDCIGEYDGMNCYNTLFVGRLAYEVTDRKLLREMEVFGPIKDLKLVVDSKTNKSRGYAFIEYEREDDMKRAYRAADGMKMEGREIVVDVERGHTVPNWLPRRLGGGLGGTRLGSPEENVTTPGRYNPNAKPGASSSSMSQSPSMMSSPMGGGMGRGGGGGGGPPPPLAYEGRRGSGFDQGGSGYGRGGGGPRGGGGGGRDYDRGGGRYGGGDYNRKRGRSRSPERRYGGGGSGRRRY